MTETQALAELLRMQVMNWRFDLLAILLVVAAISDSRSYRIPNWLTGGGILTALLASINQSVLSPHGVFTVLLGIAAGMAIMLPLYLLRAMGAGDVKLMGMIGAFIGASSVLPAALVSFAVGGVAALTWAASRGLLLKLLRNTGNASKTAMFSLALGNRPWLMLDPEQSVGRLPFAASIAAGTLLYLLCNQLGLL